MAQDSAKTVADGRTRSKIRTEDGAGDRRAALPQKRRRGGLRRRNQPKHAAAVDEGTGVPGQTPESSPSSVLPSHRTTTGRCRRSHLNPIENHDGREHAGSNSPASHRDCPGARSEGRHHQRPRRSSDEVGAERTLFRNHLAKLHAST